MPRKPPQQKKHESYLKDRRNTYGENSKSSRKNISRRKRERSRSERRLAREAFSRVASGVDLDRFDRVDARVEAKHKKAWQKCPDKPLGEVLERKRRMRR